MIDPRRGGLCRLILLRRAKSVPGSSRQSDMPPEAGSNEESKSGMIAENASVHRDRNAGRREPAGHLLVHDAVLHPKTAGAPGEGRARYLRFFFFKQKTAYDIDPHVPRDRGEIRIA